MHQIVCSKLQKHFKTLSESHLLTGGFLERSKYLRFDLSEDVLSKLDSFEVLSSKD